jgi:enoyl-CoA hydratase/carnithine racemase
VAGGIVDELVEDQAEVGEAAFQVARALAELPRETYHIIKNQLRGDVLASLTDDTATDPMLETWVT